MATIEPFHSYGQTTNGTVTSNWQYYYFDANVKRTDKIKSAGRDESNLSWIDRRVDEIRVKL